MLVSVAFLALVASTAALAQFQLFTGINGQYYFRLRANNNEIILQSEGYTDRTGMITGVNSVRDNGKSIANFETRTSVDNKPYFVLKAQNGMIIGSSETYNSVAAKDNGIQAIMTVLSSKDEIQQIDLIDESTGVFELFTDKAGQTRFRLKAVNGEIILASEGYTSKAGALNGIDSVRTNAPTYSQFELKDPSSNNQYWFVLKATNNEIIGTSEMYVTKGGRANGIYSVQRNAVTARFVDYTVVTTPLPTKVQIVQTFGLYNFLVRNSRGEVIFTSFSYKDLAAAKAAITKFQTDAKTITATTSNSYTTFGSYGGALPSGYDATSFTTELRTALSTATVEDLTVPVGRQARFTMFCGKTSGIYFNLKAANGEIILASENYKSRASAQKGIASVKANVQLPANPLADDTSVPSSFRQLTAKDSKPYFTLVATNGRVIGVSETYESTAGRDNGIASVTRNAPIAVIVDNAFGCKLRDLPRYPTGFSYDVVNAAYRQEELAAEMASGTVAASASVASLALLAVVAPLVVALF